MAENGNSYNCPKCKEQLLPPIYQCFNGHTVCKECETKLKSCPTCNDDLPKKKKIQNKALEEIIQGLTIQCQNVDQGCLETFKRSENEDHLWSCLYSKLPICSYLGLNCDSQQSLDSIVDHCKSEHGLLGFNFDDSVTNSQNTESNFIEIEQSLSFEKLEGESKLIPEWKPLYFTFKNRVLILNTKYSKQKDSIEWTTLILGSQKGTSEFFARMKFIPKEFQGTFMEIQNPVTLLKPQSESYDNDDGENDRTTFKSNDLRLKISLQSLKQFCAQQQEGKEENEGEELIPTKESTDDGEIHWKIQLRFLQTNSNDNFSAIEKPAEILKDNVPYTDKSQNQDQNEIDFEIEEIIPNKKLKKILKRKGDLKEKRKWKKAKNAKEAKKLKKAKYAEDIEEFKKAKNVKGIEEFKKAKHAKHIEKSKKAKNPKDIKKFMKLNNAKDAKKLKETKKPKKIKMIKKLKKMMKTKNAKKDRKMKNTFF